MINQADEILYRRFLSGENAAYDELMLRYGDSLTAYLHPMLDNWQDAEDLMIEAFARIMVKKPMIRDGGFRAYLYKTARNVALRFASKQGCRRCFRLDETDDLLPDPVGTEEKLLEEERRELLHRCLDRLDPDTREALWLVYTEGMSYRQTAEVLGVGEKKIDHLLSRGKQALRRELEKEGVTGAHK